MRTSEFKQKEVVNIQNGKRLGVTIDYEFDLRAGRITGIIVPSGAKFSLLSKNEQGLFIPWERIKKIGDDVILVELEA